MYNETIIISQIIQHLNIHQITRLTLIFILFVAFIFEIIAIYIVLKFGHPKSSPYISNPLDYDINNYEEVSFKSRKDSLSLSGYFMKSLSSNKSIIICHGYGNNRFKAGENVDQLKLSKLFLDYGYNVFIFDFRGHGEYAGKNGVTIGYNEQQDLLGAIDFIKSKNPYGEIGLVGFSMGAATILSVLDKTKDISFAIADSPFSDLKEYLNSNMAFWTGLPNFPFSPLVLANFKLIYGVDFNKVSPVISVAKTNVPILIIHSKKDKAIPYKESVKIASNFKNQESKLVSFPGSPHIGSYKLYEKQYVNMLKEFLKNK
ncbi:alpha/beta hydrolase [Clostridium sp. DJ247]|uniref:alpha/beta hydrolase n=1 Tax=Clostridium sp. DJ247 TaxID=2726188 RepID=UPI0016284852|nr:alpha/beta fold hydrolase [Clostridium sp. DJ247]MBC2580457.1 alpha/beta fold hydrolase [Clostridium sp. DJ247]